MSPLVDVRLLTDETIEWDAFVREAPDGSPFHLIAWKRAVQTAFGHRPRYLMAMGPTGIEGVNRFLRRLWTVVLDPTGREVGSSGEIRERQTGISRENSFGQTF